jgi:DNA-binding transcriptional MerR regulator
MLCGLSVPALRHYDEVGLLAPADVDPRTGYRRYERSQLGRARRIRALRVVELPLEEVRLVLDGSPLRVKETLEAHRELLVARGLELEHMATLVGDYLQRGVDMQGVKGVRLVALNLGVRTEEELQQATGFWSTLFDADFEDWGQGSLQMRLGEGEDFYLFNFRIRERDEPQFGFSAAFGLLVDDLDTFHTRALAAGATEHVSPRDGEGMPRYSRLEDPVGNRFVLWQG